MVVSKVRHKVKIRGAHPSSCECCFALLPTRAALSSYALVHSLEVSYL